MLDPGSQLNATAAPLLNPSSPTGSQPPAAHRPRHLRTHHFITGSPLQPVPAPPLPRRSELEVHLAAASSEMDLLALDLEMLQEYSYSDSIMMDAQTFKAR
jgi:hypothetical protein